MSKQKRGSTPRRKRMKRLDRLQAAKKWNSEYEGKNIVKGYSRYFGVNKLTAVYELEMLGFQIKSGYKKELKQNELQKQYKAEKRKQQQEQEIEASLWEESDETFAYIVGYTSGDVPYGVTWNEWDELDDGGYTGINSHKKGDNGRYIADEDLPF